MKTREVKGIAHDVIHLFDWKNPLDRIWVKNIYSIDLITEKINFPEEDSLTEFLKVKRNWFIERIKQLNGDISQFQKAVITMNGAKMKVEIIYKNKKFEDEQIYGEWMKKRELK